MGSCVVFDWARAVLSPQFLSLIPSDIDRAVLLSEVTNGLRLTTDLTSDTSCPALQGQWEDILRAQIKLIDLLTKWQEEKREERKQKISSGADNCDNGSDHTLIKSHSSDLNSSVNFKSDIKLSISNSSKANDAVESENLQETIVVKSESLQVQNSLTNLASKDEQLNQDIHNVYVISNDGTRLNIIPSLTCSIPQEQLNSSENNPEQIAMTVDNSSQLILVTTSAPVDKKIQNCTLEKNLKKEEELYMNIVLASRNDNNESLLKEIEPKEKEKFKNGVRENPLDKLCQLLKIDEEESTPETVDKKFNDFERRRRYEENMPFKYFCTDCSFKTKRENQYLKHLKLHEKIKVTYRCDRCQFTTIRIATLRRHELSHESHTINCQKCPYKTDCLKFLRRHIQVKHSANKPGFLCDQCDFAAGSLRELKKHKHLHSPVKPKLFWNCSLCSYKTQNKGHLQRHKNDVHELVRSYLCHLCGKSFKRHDTLKQHRMIHEEAEPTFTCSQCDKVCRSSTHLKEHMAVHTTQRPFLCELCGATFKTRSNQTKHIKMMHSAVKLVQCQLCKRTFSSKATMIRHQKIHRAKDNSLGETASCISKSFSSNNPVPPNEDVNSVNVTNLSHE